MLNFVLEAERGRYAVSQDDEQHVAVISKLAAKISKESSALLADGRMKFGHAQKALNLYLKYLWCLGEIPAPPHCPIDSIILGKIPSFREERWTKLDCPERYNRIIYAARAVARKKGMSLPEWELDEYNRHTMGVSRVQGLQAREGLRKMTMIDVG